MPTYEYKCSNCENEFDKILSLKEYRTPQNCPDCGSLDTHKIFTTCNFNLKGDDWPGKALKVNRQMVAKDKRLKGRQEAQKIESPVATLAPNVNGERVESWSDAKKLAASKGLDTNSYESHIRKENKLQ